MRGRGDAGTRGLGDAETRRRGDTETRRRGDTGTRRRGRGDAVMSVCSLRLPSSPLPLSASPCLPISVSPHLRVSPSPRLQVPASPRPRVSASPCPSSAHPCLKPQEFLNPTAIESALRSSKEPRVQVEPSVDLKSDDSAKRRPRP